MSKVITFSRVFQKNHPRAGQETYFREKIWAFLADQIEGFKIPDEITDWDWHQYYNGRPKVHTIRSGNRFKVGEKFSPRVWSGKPYASKQIIIAPDIELTAVQKIRIETDNDYTCVFIDDHPFYEENKTMVTQVKAFETLAKNDGLSVEDFKNWFQWPKNFEGQILIWKPGINY